MTDSYSSPGAPQVPEPVKQKNTVGFIAMIIAALGFVFACIPGALMVGWILLPIAFILAIVGLVQPNKPKGQAITAMILAVVGTIIGVLVFVFVVGSAIDDAFKDDVQISDQPQESAKAEPEETQEEAPAQSGEQADGSRGAPIAIGTAFSSSEWEVKVLSFNPDATKEVLAVNSFNEEPPAGQVYALAEIEATYIGAESGIPWVDLSIAYVTEAGNTVSEHDHVVVGPDPQFTDVGELYEGAVGSGFVVLQVPEGDQGTLRISPGMFADEVFIATN